MRTRLFVHHLFSLLISISLLLTPAAPVAQARSVPDDTPAPVAQRPSAPIGLFRTRIVVDSETRRQRLDELGIVVLEEETADGGPQTASEVDAVGGRWSVVVLVDDEQLETLARLRYEPQASDEFVSLVEANTAAGSWLAAGLAPLLAVGRTVSPTGDSRTTSPTYDSLRAAARALTPEQRTALADLTSLDDDADGLTNAQEAWWCTDPLNADSDGDGASDGAEVLAAKDWLGNRRAGPPSTGRPFAGWPPATFDATRPPTCRDGDADGVPDMAERWDLGLNMNAESTDRDKFDDGQELFGTTEWGRGALPRVTDDAGYIFAEMPTWVKAPGNHPFVAAFPVPEIDVVASSLKVETVTTVTTDHVISSGTEKSYSTAKTEGTSSSVADTVTWNEWEEVSTSLTTPVARAVNRPEIAPLVLGGLAILGTVALNIASNCIDDEIKGNESSCRIVANKTASGVKKLIETRAEVQRQCVADAYQESNPWRQAIKLDICYPRQSESPFLQIRSSNEGPSCSVPPSPQSSVLSCTGPASGIKPVSSSDVHFTSVDAANQNRSDGRGGTAVSSNNNGVITATPLHQISFPVTVPTITNTESKGTSRGGAQTTTNTQYEEHTVTNGEAFSNGESWGNATAADTAHSADLWFTYKVRNTGTEYARQIGNLAFNLYIGDSPDPAYTYFVAPDLGGDGIFQNFMPNEEHQYTSRRIPLSLEQMKAIDLGGPLRVVVEDFTYGVDELFYQDAANAGLLIALEDGTDDGDERIDSYLLPTWGEESVVDALARYFPHSADENGTVIALWTPEYRADTPAWCGEPKVVGIGGQRTLWCKHALSSADWWNVYTNGLGDGSEGFQDTPASPGAVALFRFNSDTDLDGYSDRSEARLGTDPTDAGDFPRPELLAGLHSIRSGSYVTATLSLLNTGLYDAYGVEAVLIAPDDSVSITNNTVGGSGRVRAQKQVIVGSRIALQTPLPTAWTQAGHAVPAAGGYFTGGEDRTYTFTVACGDAGGCSVASGAWSVGWSDSKGNSGSLNFGAGYASPNFLPVGALGLTLALRSGTVANGESFSVDARTPRDTFQYTINREPYTQPLVIVSYNDPQGNHRFILPEAAANLTTPSDNLAAFSGQMLDDVGVEIVTTEEYTGGTTSTSLLVNNPSETNLTGAHVFLEFINISGTVVSEVSTQVNLPPGPTTASVGWDSAAFDPAYRAGEDYIVMAFLTDYQGNILDTAGRPLSSFQDDPRPAAALDNGAQVWDFGAAQQGTLIEHPFALASVGYLDLLAYLGNAPGLSVDGPAATSISPGDVALYTVQLNTESLPVGAFEATIPVRTSDPQNPSASLTIRGTITPMPADAPGGAVLRPLDVDAAIAGDHSAGEWVNFTHSLGPDAQSLHPVKVYSQDYGTLHGVGKYATDFGAGTASADMFGDGRDGVMPGSGNLDNANGFAAGSVNGTAGATSISVTDRYAIARVNPGDVVLIHQTRGSGAGQWEMNKAVADFTGSGTFALEKPLQYTYISNGGNERAQILRVPQYTTCNVTGTVTPLTGWNGDWGGIFAVMCRDSATISGVIANSGGNGITTSNGNPPGGAGAGFRGGQGDAVNNDNYGGGFSGEGTVGPGYWEGDGTPNGNGGGAGDGTPQRGNFGTGGGGGNGTPGGDSTAGGRGAGGSVAGNPELTNIVFGGGGGGSNDNPGNSIGGGGGGGGIVVLQAPVISISGVVQANGGLGGGDKWGAGGGAGGSILVRGKSINVGTSKVIASGGAARASGGAGAVGRIRVEYCDSLTGTTNPSASTQKLNCYIAEQVESAPYNTARLNLPKPTSEVRNYKVQYGRRLQFSGAGTQTTTIRLPKQLYSDATLDALVNNTGVASGPLALSVDFGNDGTADWSRNATTSFPATLNVTGTVSSLNAWLVSRTDVAWGAEVDVPVRLTLDRQANVMLTNLALTPLGAKTRFVRLEARTYSTATLGLEFRQPGVPSGPLAFTVDVGADGTVDWSYAGTPSFPARLTSPNLAAAVSSYLSGRSGDVDVPIRIVPSPFLAVSLTDFDASPSDRPDLLPLAPTAGVARSGEPIVEGDTIPLTAVVQNNGSADSGPLAVTFFATRNSPPASFYIGTSFVSNVPKTGSALASIQWNTLGFSGDVTVRAVVDPFDRTAEGNENNNSASALIPIRTRPDLHVTAIALSNPLLMAGETVTVTLTLSNTGQTAAGSQTVALFDANPDSGGDPVWAQYINVAPLPGESETTVQFQWTPTAPGPYRLFSLSDKDGAVSESDEGNNRAWQDVYVGLAAPVLLDSGPTEPLYSAAAGYGVVDEGQPDAFVTCGSGVTPEETQRLDFDGRLVYRFDHLLPGRFYHLDVTLYECTGAGRQESISIDGNTVDGPINLGDGEVHRRSILIDPALYADHSVQVSIEVPGVNGALVSAVNLHAIDYRYADAGGTNDPDYNPARGYGALNGVRSAAWGSLPYQSVRVNQTGRNVTYRYDGLTPGRNYQLHLSFYQSGDNNRVQQVEIDGKPVGAEQTLVNGQKERVSLAVPPASYSDDGSISVSVVRTNADVGAIVNEIALEEQTIPAAVCGVRTTPSWSQAYGSVTIAGQPAPPGTVVTAQNPDGVIVGCFQVTTTGFYGFMPVFGADAVAVPSIPGMADGQQVKFRVNGSLATPSQPLVWTNDKDIHRIDLAFEGIDSQWFTLNPGWNLFSLRVQPPVTSLDSVLDSIKTAYCRVQGEVGAYDCTLALQFQQLKELHGARGYYLRVEGSSSVNLLVQGTPITPTLPIPLHTDWNWVGYLLQNNTPVGEALGSIAGSYLRVADGKGRLYDPALPQFSTLTHLSPGDGYLVFATQAATLVYPPPVEAAVTEPVAVHAVCPDAVPTLAFTWLYGDFRLNDRPAPPGTRVDVLTPRDELAGCAVVDTAGQYGFLPVYGGDGGNPPIPGFVEGEVMRLRVNGQAVNVAGDLRWRNDKDSHRLDLAVTVKERVFLPAIGGASPVQGEELPADGEPPVYLPLLGR